MEVTIYTDGSYSTNYPLAAGSGYVILDENRKLITQGSDIVVSEEILKSRQIGGELKAVMCGINKALELGADEILIRYDYEGINFWITGQWKTKKTISQQYREYVLNKTKGIKLSFLHVGQEHHSGYNQVAEDLAHEAVLKHYKQLKAS